MGQHRIVSVLVLVLIAGPLRAGWFATDLATARYPRAYYGLGSGALQFGYHNTFGNPSRYGDVGAGHFRAVEFRRFDGQFGFGVHLAELCVGLQSGFYGAGAVGVCGHLVTVTGSHSFQYASASASFLPWRSFGLYGRVEYALVPFVPVPAEVFASAGVGVGDGLFGDPDGYWHAAAGVRVGLGWWVMEDKTGQPGFGLDR